MRMRRVELVTAERMRDIERAAMDGGMVTGLELMERAGRAVVRAIRDEWPLLGPGSGATVVCGPGNNGGDGFVVARLLREEGWRVRVLAVPTARRGAEATWARMRWKRAGGRTLPMTAEAFWHGDRNAPNWSDRSAEPFQDLYVDALFGIGARGPMGGEVGEALAHWAGSGGDHDFYKSRTVAIDLPSGLDADSGRVPGYPDERFDPFRCPVPAAKLTVTFDSPKPGHVLGLGPELCGRVLVADIGLGQARAMATNGSGLGVIRSSLLVGFARPAPARAELRALEDLHDPRDLHGGRPLAKWGGHKYDHGHALVLTGGVGRGGAARLAARSALRIGAGAVTLCCPPAALIENASRVDAVMTRPLRDASALSEMLKDRRLNALVLGPGLGTGEREAALVATALGDGRGIVLDADALTLLAGREDKLGRLHERCVLTPHLGEFRRLCPDLARRLSPPQRLGRVGYGDFAPQRMRADAEAHRAALNAERAPLFSRIDAAREASARLGCVVLLKGPDTVIAEPLGRVSVNAASGSRAAPWLATAGAGDVLSGMIGGLLARGFAPFDAACAAAWLHVEAARDFGPGLIAEDLPDALPAVLRRIETG